MIAERDFNIIQLEVDSETRTSSYMLRHKVGVYHGVRILIAIHLKIHTKSYRYS